MKNIESNLWKIFVYILTNRRHYIVLSSVFFLMQTGATEKMLGYSMSLGMLAGFLMEIPSGYFADRFGHKKTLILSKIFMLGSSLLYAFTGGVVGLFVAAVCISLGFSLMSGTIQAFTHETLQSLKRDKEYAGVMSKIKGKVSLIQVFTFALFPMIASYNIRFPFYLGIVIDLVGLRVVWQFVEPLIHKELKKAKSLWHIIKEQAGTDFYYVALFFSMIGAFMLGFSTFREPYLVSIGFIIFYIGLVPAGSRLMWWVFSYLTGRMSKNIKLNQLMTFDMCLFPLLFITIAMFPNMYYVGLVLAVCQGYMYARGPLISQYLIEQLPDPRYKYTALSLKSQIGMLFGVIAPLSLGYLVSVETVLGQYRDGVFIRGVILFAGLMVAWLLWRRKKLLLSSS